MNYMSDYEQNVIDYPLPTLSERQREALKDALRDLIDGGVGVVHQIHYLIDEALNDLIASEEYFGGAAGGGFDLIVKAFDGPVVEDQARRLVREHLQEAYVNTRLDMYCALKMEGLQANAYTYEKVLDAMIEAEDVVVRNGMLYTGKLQAQHD